MAEAQSEVQSPHKLQKKIDPNQDKVSIQDRSQGPIQNRPLEI